MLTIREGLLSVLKVLCIVLFSVLVLVVVWQVFTRQVLGAPSPWTTVTAQYMFVWLSLFAATLVFGERGHIAVDFLALRAPGVARHVLIVLVQGCTLAFAVLVMVWGGIRGMSMSWDQVIPGFPFTVGLMYLALPVTGLMIAFLALEDLVLAVRGDDRAPLEETDDEAAESSGAAAAAAVVQDQGQGQGQNYDQGGGVDPAAGPGSRPDTEKEH
ncbi:MAG: TRAP transporter small permease [Brachybacterium tyrofermentans]|uniref:TRAP transporter small permease n=1 Tax=Brachybacterium tyrofermentans TaxID=47848 RepID=UPI000A1AB369|nr:TRAP-type C4-dicarboxylate transport system, small permease component [Corynebacterium xerosis]